MTFGELLFWIIIAVIAYFLLKVGLVILIIVIVLIVLYYIFDQPATNTISYPYHEYYQQIYPNSFFNNYNNNYDANIPFHNYNDNWYVPVQQYYNEKQNLNYYYEPFDEVSNMPPSVSEYCVNKHLQETGDLVAAISKCQVPVKTSPSAIYAPPTQTIQLASCGC